VGNLIDLASVAMRLVTSMSPTAVVDWTICNYLTMTDTPSAFHASISATLDWYQRL